MTLLEMRNVRLKIRAESEKNARIIPSAEAFMMEGLSGSIKPSELKDGVQEMIENSK